MENERFNDPALSEKLENRIHTELLSVSKELTERGQTIAAAESLTGGLFSAFCVDIPGSSEWFMEGFVTYSLKAKIERLGIPEELIEQNTMIDADVALEMAKNARKTSGADYAVSMTGLAGPFFHSDGTPYPMDPRHQPGLLFVACAGPNGEAVHRFVLTGARNDVRRQAVLKAVLLLKNVMKTEE